MDASHSRRTCTEPDCTRPHYARGPCISHYNKARLKGKQEGTWTPLPLEEQIAARKPSICREGDCEEVVAGRGLCRKHYRQLRRTLMNEGAWIGRGTGGWHGDTEGHKAAGRKGGAAISANRDHMAELGSRGGRTLSQDREYMAEIGKRGASARLGRCNDNAQDR